MLRNRNKTQNKADQSENNRPVMGMMEKAGEKMGAIKSQIMALMAADLGRMPKVQELIWSNFGHLEELQHKAAEHIYSSTAMILDHLWHFPEAQDVILTNLAGIPEVKREVDPLVEKGMEEKEAIVSVMTKLGEFEVPEHIRTKLAELPNVRRSVVAMMENMEQMKDHVLEMIGENIAALTDVQSLVFRNMHQLPDLDELRQRYFAARKPQLKSIEHCPKWMQDNKFILSGYRPELLSMSKCLLSLTYLHNESGNIYTHLLAGVAFIVSSIWAGCYIHHDKHWIDQAVFYTFMASAITCLLCSAVFHTCYCHSAALHLWFTRLDYVGIVSLISGSVYTVIYFLWYCHPEACILYTAVTTVLGCATMWSLFSPSLNGPGSQHYRVLLFIALAASGMLSGLHYFALYGVSQFAEIVDTQSLFVWSCPLYLVGAAVYVMKIPERFLPGRFDYFLHSHQLWHLFVIAAAVAHYFCLHHMMMYRDVEECQIECQTWEDWDHEPYHDLCSNFQPMIP